MMKKARTLQAFCACTEIGIDVCKADLEVVGLFGEEVIRKTLANTPAVVERFAQGLQAGGYRGKLLCESTGHYHLLLGLACSRHGLDLRIVNPLQSSKHQKARIRKTKTDSVDGYVLATMCRTERDLPKPSNLQPRQVLMRLKQGQLHALDKHLQRLSRSVAAYRETYRVLGFEWDETMQALEGIVKQLKAVRRRMTEAYTQLLTEGVAAPEELERLRRLPGFSATVAGMVGTAFDREVKGYRSWVAYAGLDVSVRESGNWHGRGRLTKRGNSYLRKRLYCAAWGAVMNHTEVRRYYDRLKGLGRKHVEALCMIARKLLRIAYAVLVKGKEYDPAIAFPE